jgi:hypothetical protein
MTLDKLIERLEWMKGQVGGDCEVRVVDAEGEWGFGIFRHQVEDEKSETGTGNVVLIDITAEPE